MRVCINVCGRQRLGYYKITGYAHVLISLCVEEYYKRVWRNGVG